MNCKAYRVRNIRTQTIMKFANIVIDDFKELVEFFVKEKITEFIEN